MELIAKIEAFEMLTREGIHPPCFSSVLFDSLAPARLAPPGPTFGCSTSRLPRRSVVVNPSPISLRTKQQTNNKPKQTQMKINTTLATIVAVTLMGSALCHAQEAPDKKQKQFDKLDADKNGSISLEEFKAASKTPDTADKKFARLDADKNGSVSLEEFSASKAKAPKPKKPAAPAQE